MDNDNPLITDAIDAVMKTICARFDLVFARPDAAEIVQGFIAGEIAFQIFGDHIAIARLEDVEAPDEVPAEWLDGDTP
ncbi:hypothetical protein [Streptomyces sp. MZ04]|uniref:hypothetical protein n=1 Tax=Streptomyces sp. MZ04 TaxID=2559236 RepID=UPI00107ECE9F|nr:hypothetical protein [Streptomyces sp. MZ04]TGB12618.1 hypothetical protein E2651_11580 [Streptomyces sp. MZ04]